ncbi:unnamed protein product [Dovyalis caffra]|uniref:GDSL esterase/lipase 1-like n=1 Tax=Dovyalis caffra TaxID=77055 RepID=A0AAV1RU10_9ROSI|nr:unnamed protein product [Dovyalis caffra]
MGTWRFNSICFLVFCASLLIPAGSHSYSDVALFIFGDSLYDVGNNNYLKDALGRVNMMPYGETFFKHPTGRASDGRLIPDFIAEFAKLPLIPPYLQPGGNHQFQNGVNFASGGAGALVETNQGQVIDLKTQLKDFKNMAKQLRQKLGASEVKTLLSTAVYMFSIGSNDYFVPFATNSTVLQSYSRKEYVKMVIGNITTVIQEIYKTGGRKFGLSNLAALGCVPAMRALKLATTGGSGCMDEATVLAKLHNRAIPKAFKELENQLKGFTYSIFDSYKVANEIFNNPSKYGFKEVKMACCGSGPYRGSFTCGLKGYELCDDVSEYLFFDAVHPTEKANHQIAELMWNGKCFWSNKYGAIWRDFFKHPTGRASDGRLIPDFIAEFAKLPLIPPYLQPGDYHQFSNGVNFASGGAGALVETHQGRVMDLKTQLSNFKNMEKQLKQKLGASEVKTFLSTAVYIFSIGSNDYLVPFTENSTVLQSYSREEYVKMVIGNITTVIQEIYKIGGRKFGLLNLAAFGCIPSLRALKLATAGGSGCMDEVTVLAKLHNRAFPKAVMELESQLKGFTYSIFDFYTAVNERLNNPSKYGFKEVKMACCGSGPYRASGCGLKGYLLCDDVSEYLFFDAVHPTEKANYQFAELMWNGSTKIIKPYNLKSLFEK